uniref:DNA topoisomerase II n=1 Tax=Balamuthia mandrillaris TaxID=66527 RepID=UPI0018FE02F9|nr:Chain A, DNA topoisomerase II [Balamuthia mandrillaris]
MAHHHHHHSSAADRAAKTPEELYQKKTPIEHVLLRPDTYLGSVLRTTEPGMWVYDPDSRRMVERECTYVPALYKIFDEILVNAADNKQRDPNTSTIEVNIDADTNTISVFNDGRGIPVHVHKTEGMYLPEMLFGHLLTSSNYDDSEAKVTGGRNGYGAKLTNIYSKEFTVETVDCERGLRFQQTWRDNMSVREEPLITPLSPEEKAHGDYTKITFRPDLSRLDSMHSLRDGDIIGVMSRRAFDVAACNEGLDVYLNGEKLPSGFKGYVQLYHNPDVVEDAFVFEQVNDRWQIVVGPSLDGQFTQQSFVNSIHTRRGGTHVTYILDQLTKHIVASIRRDHPDLTKIVQPALVRNHLSLFINALIENPSFDSQTKETLTTQPSRFGSKCKLSDEFLERVVQRTRIVEEVTRWAELKQKDALNRAS